MLTVGRNGQAGEARLARQLDVVQLVPAGHIPQADGPVDAAGDDVPAIRREGSARHRRLVPLEPPQLVPGGGIVKANHALKRERLVVLEGIFSILVLVVAHPRQGQLAVGREGHAIDRHWIVSHPGFPHQRTLKLLQLRARQQAGQLGTEIGFIAEPPAFQDLKLAEGRFQARPVRRTDRFQSFVHGVGELEVSAERLEGQAGVHVPGADEAIVGADLAGLLRLARPTAGQSQPPIGGEGHGVNAPLVPVKTLQLGAGRHIPEAERIVGTADEDGLAIGGQGEVEDAGGSTATSPDLGCWPTHHHAPTTARTARMGRASQRIRPRRRRGGARMCS